MQLSGLDRETAEAMAGRARSGPLSLPKALAAPVRIALAGAGQWRVGGLGGALGFDYAALDVTARWLGIEVTPDVFRDLRAIEAEALAVIRERSA